MRSILLSCSLLLAANVNSQITVTNTDFADGGDTVRISTATDPTIDYASTGTNFTWDFSTLTANSQTLRDYKNVNDASAGVQFMFGMFAPVDYQATNFVASDAIPLDLIGQFLPINISEVNQMSKISSSAVTSVGFSLVLEGNEIPFRSDVIETRYELPLDFGNVYASNGFTELDMNPIYNGIWRQYRTRDSNVDGWGSITTPYGTFDCLRVRHNITEQDSLYFEAFGFGTWVELPVPNSSIYEWWTNGELEPVLRITVNDVLGQEVVSGIEFRDNYDANLDPNLSVNELELEVGVYPNPTSEDIKISGLQAGMSVVIVDERGAIILSEIVSSDKLAIHVSDYATGTYKVLLRSPNGQWGSTSFVKQ